MISYTVLILSAFASAQCQMYSMPYPRPCGSAIPVNPPYAYGGPTIAAPYPVPTTLPKIPLPATVPKMALTSCELPVPLPVVPQFAVAPTPYEIVLPNMASMPAPYELALPLSLPNLSCGCLEGGLSRPIAELPLGMPLANPFLPAASPVSALAPFSPLLPPASPCSRCQYLKKIPIPPPCI